MGSLGIALLMFAENVFPPIPSELIMPLAGFSAAQGQRNLVIVIVKRLAPKDSRNGQQNMAAGLRFRPKRSSRRALGSIVTEAKQSLSDGLSPPFEP
jgi:hypothetical protein